MNATMKMSAPQVYNTPPLFILLSFPSLLSYNSLARSRSQALCASNQLSWRTTACPIRSGEHPKATVRLLVDADGVWKNRKKVELALDEAEGPFRGCKVLEVPESAYNRSVLAKQNQENKTWLGYEQKKPIPTPQRWPSKLVLGISAATTSIKASGVVHVGIW